MRLLRPPRDPAEALLWRTRVNLTTVTLLLVTALVVSVGITTAVVATALMRDSIDRALDAAVSDPLTLHELLESSEHPSEYTGPLGRADTLVMLVDQDGNVYGNTTPAVLPGLPDVDAIAGAATGEDRRSDRYGRTDLRLLTLPYRTAVVQASDAEGESEDEFDDELEDTLGDEVASSVMLYLQAGHDLSLQKDLERQLLLAIGLIGLLGIGGAVVVTLFVTQRALVPIREAFDTERRFVATASHELRTPVAIIRASAEILAREDLVAESGRELVEDIVGETDRMGRLVGDLMALASAEAGAVSMDLRPLPLAPYFADIGRRCASIAEARGVQLVTEGDGLALDASILADRDRLDQLLLILVDNALRHSPPDAAVHLRLQLEPASRTVAISVTDEGPGIPADERERIFEPFTRLGSTRERSEGAGLGLAIARQLARQHDADLSVISAPGRGTTFLLRLSLLDGRR